MFSLDLSETIPYWVEIVRKVISNFDLSKTPSPDCTPVVVSKNCKPDLSYVPAELCNKFVKETSFPNCWQISLVVPIFKSIEEWPTAKNYCPVSLLSLVVKVFENFT